MGDIFEQSVVIQGKLDQTNLNCEIKIVRDPRLKTIKFIRNETLATPVQNFS